MESGEPTVSRARLLAALDTFGLLDIVSALQIELQGPIILFGSQASDNVCQYVSQQIGESGGLLMGVAATAERVAGSYSIICVSEVIASEKYRSNLVSLTIDSSIWLSAELRQKVGLMVVGWFHSHLGRGAYFSGADLATQRRFFSHEYSLGYVVDPIYDDHAYFLGPESIELDRQSVLTVPSMSAIVSSLLR